MIDVPPAVRGKVLSPDAPLYITEGIKKAEAAASRTVACVGLLGVWGWKNQDDFWRNVPIRGRVVYIVFESDIEKNPDVKRAAAALFAFLESMGACPKLILLPAKDGTKVGLDDFFAAGNSVEALLSHVTDQAPSFVDEMLLRNAAVYEELDGGIVRISRTKDGPVCQPLTNFTAGLISQTVFLRGSQIERELEIEGTIAGKSVTVTLPAEEFDRIDWIIPQLGAEAVIYAGHGVKDEVRAAIQILSGNIPQFVGVDRLGWHEINGTPVYVHAAGVIVGETQVGTDLIEGNRTDDNLLSENALATPETDGPIFPTIETKLGVRTHIPPSLSRYALPAPSIGKPLQNNIRASLKLALLAIPTIGLPIYCAIWYAALATADFALHLFGSTGILKTELTALMVQHFGAEIDARHLPANWGSTTNFLRSIAAHAGNVLLPVDDFVPNGSQYDIDRAFRAAEDVFRSQGNAAGRGRCYRDGTPQEPAPPRCLILSTGEVRPHGHSLTARVLMLEARPGDILDRTDDRRVADFTKAQNQAKEGVYARVMSAFLHWVARNYDEQQRLLQERSLALRNEFATACHHARTADIAGKLLAGFERFLDFACEAGAIDEVLSEVLLAHAINALLDVLAAQDKEQHDEDPAQRYLELLRTAFATGRAHLVDLVKDDK